jgi:FAD/FMN-containing dehydrogenase
VNELAGWGRYPRHQTELLDASDPQRVARALTGNSGLVTRGNGRAYGDAAIGERVTLAVRGLNRMRSFDPASGRLTVEAGVLLSEIIRVFLPLGFFPPVVPGTKHVTIGGMIAADIHGKNHHRDGGFGGQVERLKLALPDGSIVDCSREDGQELFAATVGGMGLTGTILEATFRLKPIETGWLRQQTIVAEDLDAAMAALRESDDATYSVAWIDCLARGPALGRALVFVAEHATREDFAVLRPPGKLFPDPRGEKLSAPIDLPGWVLRRPTVAAFNALYFRLGAAKAERPSWSIGIRIFSRSTESPTGTASMAGADSCSTSA